MGSANVFTYSYHILGRYISPRFKSRKIDDIFLIVCSYDIKHVARCVSSIRRKMGNEAVISVLVNNFTDPDIRTAHRHYGITELANSTSCNIDFVFYNAFNTSTALIRSIHKERVYGMLDVSGCSLDKSCFTYYIDPDMEFVDLDVLSKSIRKEGLKVYGHRGGYFDFKSTDIKPYMFYNHKDSIVSGNKVSTVAGLFIVNSKVDKNVDTTTDVPLFWFDDNDRAYRFREKGYNIGLIPYSHVNHFSPHAASSNHKELYDDKEFIKGRQWLKKKWFDSGKIKYIVPDPKDDQFKREGKDI